MSTNCLRDIKENMNNNEGVYLAKLVRESASLSKAEMARRMDMSRQAYQLFEERNTSATETQLLRLREIFPGTDAQFCRIVVVAGKKAVKESKAVTEG